MEGEGEEAMPPFIFLGLIVLILLWMLCTWSDEREQSDVSSVLVMMEVERDAGHSGERSLFPQKNGTFNKELPYSRLKRQPKIRDQKSTLGHDQGQNLRLGASSPTGEEDRHNHQEYPPEAPEALRPRRVILARPPEEEEDDAVVKKSAAVQTDDETDPVFVKSPKTSVGTQKGIETEEWSSQTDISPLRPSRGVQADVEQEDIGVEALPHVTGRGSQVEVATQDARVQTEEAPVPKVSRRASSEEEPEDSLESYPLKPKYLSSPSQSEEESDQESSQSEALRQRYSIIQPFMREMEEE